MRILIAARDSLWVNALAQELGQGQEDHASQNQLQQTSTSPADTFSR
ncbi:MAG: hypothetical protein JO372_13460 [Solirubrobacterales bacterium]|nr:hypothetical protein [Solirubrobacterales bacterium]